MLSPIPYRKLSKQLRTVRLQDAAAEPVSLADYQQYVRQANLAIPQAAFDVKIRAARRLCEKHLGQALVSQCFNAIMDLPPGIMSSIGSVLARFEGYIPTAIELLYAPLRQVSSISVVDDTGFLNECPSSIYWVGQQRVSLLDTQVWPDTLGRAFETFNVQYTSGYAIPFVATASSAVLTTAQPHGLSNGSTQRAWTTSDGALPGGLNLGVDYFVVNATTFTLGLSATLNGSAINTTNKGTGNAFLGAIPENFIRAILATAAVDFYPEKKKTTRFDVAQAGALPDLAKELLSLDRWLNL
ncbi:MAG TPA: hypothetical protein VHY84_27360 [Bryobacteraceae bacterium]|jgi:hypothetical protein|nr:hypothetical protein [Bryobacteraceae bacterium]